MSSAFGHRYNALVKRKHLPTGLMAASLALLALLLLLVACEEAPSTPTASETATAELSTAAPATQVIEGSPALASPTAGPLPTAEFGGVRITFDESLVGSLEDSGVRPVQAPGTTILAQPARIMLTFEGNEDIGSGQLMVFPVDEYKKISELASAHISNLKAILDEQPLQPPKPLLLFPSPAIAERFLAEPDYVEFDEGLGIAFVTEITDAEQPYPLYVFQGLSYDERHYVTALWPILTSPVGDPAADGLASDTSGEVAPVLDREVEAGIAVGSIQNALSSVLASLEVKPDEALLPAGPDAYLAYSGVLLGYDPSISGTAVPAKKPPIYLQEDGTVVFLEGAPDAIHVTFGPDVEDGTARTLLIQPVKGESGQFYQSIPVGLQQKVMALENEVAARKAEGEALGGKNFERFLPFASGGGKRWVQETSAPTSGASGGMDIQYVYEYEGVTDGGQYFVQLRHPLPFSGVIDDTLLSSDSRESGSFFAQLGQLDNMMQSLVVTPEASTESSIPENNAECTNEAQFIDDVTVSDEAVVESGQVFTKVWLVRNTGTCTWTPAYGLAFAGGNPLEWRNAAVTEIVAPGDEIELSSEIVSPATPGLYEAWWQLVDDQGQPFGPNYRVLFESPRPATDIPGYGVIRGEVSYPASGMPAMTIYFLRTDNSQRFALETEEGWVNYANELPVGDYYVFARVSGDESDSGGGYTEAVLCGMTCDDHQLVPVTIEEGKATENIAIADWYAPSGTFPLP